MDDLYSDETVFLFERDILDITSKPITITRIFELLSKERISYIKRPFSFLRQIGIEKLMITEYIRLND